MIKERMDKEGRQEGQIVKESREAEYKQDSVPRHLMRLSIDLDLCSVLGRSRIVDQFNGPGNVALGQPRHRRYPRQHGLTHSMSFGAERQPFPRVNLLWWVALLGLLRRHARSVLSHGLIPAPGALTRNSRYASETLELLQNRSTT